MTTPLITDRRPTKRDEDEHGEVLYLRAYGWCPGRHNGFGSASIPWTHTPLWVDPGPDLKEQLEEDLARVLRARHYPDELSDAVNRICDYVRSQLAK